MISMDQTIMTMIILSDNTGLNNNDSHNKQPECITTIRFPRSNPPMS